MKKSISIILLIFLFFSCSQQKPKGFELKGEIVQVSLNKKEIILFTQVDELSDTVVIENNAFSFDGFISEPTNAVLVIDGVILRFPLVNDNISMKIVDLYKEDYEIKYTTSRIQENLNSYFNQEVKVYEKQYKELISLEVQSESDSIKMLIQSFKDSLSINFMDNIVIKYSQMENREGLAIILSDLTKLFGTKNHPQKIEAIYDLLPIAFQNGFYGKGINTYLEQSYKLAIGEIVNFKFLDIDNKLCRVSDFIGKLVLVEFWATWCGPCLSQLPSLKEINQSNKIEIISISIDDNIERWKIKVPELEMNWTNIHYKQEENLKDKFFVTGIPYNVLLSQEGKILRKNIGLSELIELLK